MLIEGPAGVGKTDLAVSAAKALGFALLRLQCYEGLDDSKALYEWKYGKQLLYTQILKEKIGLLVDDADTLEGAFTKLAGFQDLFFSRDFLEARPLLQAMEQHAAGTRARSTWRSRPASGKPMCRCRQRRFNASPSSRVLLEVRMTSGGTNARMVPISGMVTW